jgi:hypothetical protein
MKMRLLLSAIVLVWSGSNAIAQEDVIIIDKGDLVRTRMKKEPKQNYNDRVIKFAPFNMLVGEVGMGYEHKVNAISSLDFEAGITISELGFDSQNHFWGWSQRTVRSAGLGFFGRVGYRFYPLDNTQALNRFYISPALKYKLRTYNYSSFSMPDNDQVGQQNQLNFVFDFGYQWWISEAFCIDFFAGMGIGYEQVTEWQVDDLFINNEWTSQWSSYTNAEPRLIGDIGIKVGIGSKSKGGPRE